MKWIVGFLACVVLVLVYKADCTDSRIQELERREAVIQKLLFHDTFDRMLRLNSREWLAPIPNPEIVRVPPPWNRAWETMDVEKEGPGISVPVYGAVYEAPKMSQEELNELYDQINALLKEEEEP